MNALLPYLRFNVCTVTTIGLGPGKDWDMINRDIDRGAEAYTTGIFASVFIAILILASWIAYGADIGQSPRTSYLLCGFWDIGHSRYWDTLIGFYGMVFMFLITTSRGSEPGGLAEDIAAIVVATVLGSVLAHVFYRHDVNLAGWRFLAMVWGCGFVGAALIPFARTFRFGSIIYAALAFGFSLYAGILLGLIVFMALGAAYLGGALARARLINDPLTDTSIVP